MRYPKLTAFAVLSLFATLVPAYAQHGDERPEEKQSKPQQRQTESKSAPKAAPEQHQQRAAPVQQARPEQARPEQAKTQQPARPAVQPKPQPQHTAAVKAQPARLPAKTQQVQARPQPAPVTHSRTSAAVQPAPQRTEQQARSWQQQKGWVQGGASVGHATFQQDRSQNWAVDHRTWAQRGGYGGYYIPQAQFTASFGIAHYFRLGALPVMYQGYPRFSYGGFAFLMLDPWPGDWPANWYSADDVYVGYDSGYYLYNRQFPQERLAITIQI